jgi:hypothetical protein
MRWAFACIGLLCAASALAEQPAAPFAPLTNVPDYVGTMIGERGTPKEYVRTVMHHGAWTRVDNKLIFYHTTAHFSPAGPIEIHLHLSARANNEVVSADFVRGDIRSVGWDYEPRAIGERQTLLGETCTVWDVARSGHLVRSSCITDDGIELWSKVVGGYGILSSVEATRIERRPVAPDDVRPDDARRARELLAIGPWLRPAATSSDTQAGADYEVVMQLTSKPNRYTSPVRTTRRHGDWTFVDQTGGEAERRLTIENEAARFMMIFTSEGSGSRQRLMLYRLPDELPPPLGGAPKDLNRSEQILGEKCEWFDVEPDSMDAGLDECRTSDGITLKSTTWSGWNNGGEQIFAATHLSRRPLRLDQVMPLPDLFEPKRWGLD